MDVRVDEITGVRFVREPYPFPFGPQFAVVPGPAARSSSSRAQEP